METGQNWQRDEFHPSGQCFFCKKHPAVAHEHEELYKVIRNGTGFPGYVVNFTTVRIPIPTCALCSTARSERNSQLGMLWFLSWIIASLIIFCIAYTQTGELIGSLIGSIALGVPLAIVPHLFFAITLGLCRRQPYEVADDADYPVVKRLLSLDWQSGYPRAKYGKRKNEGIDEDTIRRLNMEYQEEAKCVIEDFLLWCRTQDNRNESK